MTWHLVSSRPFEKSARRIPKLYVRRVEDWVRAHADGFSTLDELAGVKWLVNNKRYGRVRFGKYRLGFIADKKTKHIILLCIGARGDFYKQFPPV